MAFTLEEQARLLLDPPSRVRRDDAAGFTSCCGLVSCSVPLRTPPLDDARGPHYRGPWHLPEPDFHQLAALSLSLSYVTTTSLSSWRPSCWTHSSNAGSMALRRRPSRSSACGRERANCALNRRSGPGKDAPDDVQNARRPHAPRVRPHAGLRAVGSPSGWLNAWLREHTARRSAHRAPARTVSRVARTWGRK